jgi:DNA polymerase-3 subunit delta
VFPEKTISLEHVSEVASHSSIFNPFHWIDALLAGEGERAVYILNHLRVEGSEIVMLMRLLQKNLIMLLDLFYNREKEPIRKIMERRGIWGHRQSIFIKIVHRIDLSGLRKAFQILTEIELSIKKNNDCAVWSKLEYLSLLVCHYPAYLDLYDI